MSKTGDVIGYVVVSLDSRTDYDWLEDKVVTYHECLTDVVSRAEARRGKRAFESGSTCGFRPTYRIAKVVLDK